jgi:hypothetical protein
MQMQQYLELLNEQDLVFPTTYPDVACVDTLTYASISMTDNHKQYVSEYFESDGSSEGSSVFTSFH